MTYDMKSSPDVLQTLPELLRHPYFYKDIIQLDQEEMRRIYAFEMDMSMVNAAKDALFDALKSGYDELNNGLKDVSF